MIIRFWHPSRVFVSVSLAVPCAACKCVWRMDNMLSATRPQAGCLARSSFVSPSCQCAVLQSRLAATLMWCRLCPKVEPCGIARQAPRLWQYVATRSFSNESMAPARQSDALQCRKGIIKRWRNDSVTILFLDHHSNALVPRHSPSPSPCIYPRTDADLRDAHRG